MTKERDAPVADRDAADVQVERRETNPLTRAFIDGVKARGRERMVVGFDVAVEASRAAATLLRDNGAGELIVEAAAATWGDLLAAPPAWMLGSGVDARNALQQSGHVHPFTCATQSCRELPDGGTLTAVDGGWVCEVCGYTQALGGGETWPFVGKDCA